MFTKEEIENGYIKNDQGELRELFVKSAESYGYKIYEGHAIEWLDYDNIYVFKESYISTGIWITGKLKLSLRIQTIVVETKREVQTKTLQQLSEELQDTIIVTPEGKMLIDCVVTGKDLEFTSLGRLQEYVELYTEIINFKV